MPRGSSGALDPGPHLPRAHPARRPPQFNQGNRNSRSAEYDRVAARSLFFEVTESTTHGRRGFAGYWGR
ncbi:hypothetical protein GUJ93_ZPchr0002g26209 [Zizania palustris]|uniref:Uncharacterized protein n=1 Tax=Zizania palustris TaxID=103762 RepID=A0A8J5RCX8_ZIZPA|nr:hypothetical protein GUJ93_ZPchr0002g26209 [Zizania palustris]